MEQMAIQKDKEMKGGKEKMDYKEIKQKIPYANCPYCNAEIKSLNLSEKEVEHNLKIHMENCDENPSKEDDGKQ